MQQQAIRVKGILTLIFVLGVIWAVTPASPSEARYINPDQLKNKIEAQKKRIIAIKYKYRQVQAYVKRLERGSADRHRIQRAITLLRALRSEAKRVKRALDYNKAVLTKLPTKGGWVISSSGKKGHGKGNSGTPKPNDRSIKFFDISNR